MITPLVLQNDIYLYFETIRQLRAKSVLDIGMTLKRCGAICRQVADSSIDPSVFLCGIDLDPETTVPIYRSIYQEILTQEELMEKRSVVKVYELAVLLGLPRDVLMNKALISFLKKNTECLLTDHEADRYLLPSFSQKKIKTITLDNSQYYLIKGKSDP